MSQALFDRFTRLCEIPSPTGAERAVADDVMRELREIGVAVVEDDSAGPARAGAGNLIAHVPGTGEGWLSMFAHIDTVPHEGAVEVTRAGEVFKSAGDTILGADNKAAVAVLMELAAKRLAEPAELGLELVFTVAEEDGLRGAEALDTDGLRAPFGYVIDHATPIGDVIVAAPTYKRLVCDFRGKEAHSGINPEDGHSAIAAAAGAISRMELGRLDDETTANVGVISGGTASNVVAGHCELLGEARSIDGARAAEVVGEMVDACSTGASDHGCDADVKVIEMFRGYRNDPDGPAARAAAKALERCGFKPTMVATGGGSDANALMAKGYECVLLANGTTANHTPHETVAGEALTGMLAVLDAALEEAAAC